MAIDSGAIWEVRTGGSDNNGGGFNPQRTFAGTDYSLQDAAQVVIDGTTISAAVHTTTSMITLSGYTVNSDDIGNHVQITGGTATAGVYEITTIDDANNRWTLDRSAGTAAQTVVGNMGGAMASPARPLAYMVAGNTIFLKYSATPYEVTSTTANITDGRLDFNVSGSGTARIHLHGYDTNRDISVNDANCPTIKAGASLGSTVLVTLNNANSFVSITNVILDCNSRSGVGALSIQGRCNYAKWVTAINGGGSAHVILIANNAALLQCEVADSTTNNYGGIYISSASAVVIGCVVRDHVGRAFDTNAQNASSFRDCIAYNCSNATHGWGFYVQGSATNAFMNCVAFNCEAGGFRLQSADSFMACLNCVVTENGGFGFGHNSLPMAMMLLNCAGYDNTSGNYPTGGTLPTIIDFVALSGDPFTSTATDDFSLNSTAGAGADCKAAGIGPVGQTSAIDIGAVQSAGSGGSTVIVIED